MMSTLKVVRELDCYKVRNLCCKNGYYTCGSCGQYSNMFKMVENINKDYNDESVYLIALDIAHHSDLSEFYNESDINEFINGIWWELLNCCINTMLVDVDNERYLQ